VKNIVAGCVVAAPIFMVLLAYAQQHHKCFHGRLLKTLCPCGSLSPSPQRLLVTSKDPAQRELGGARTPWISS
jgi:hypothetical protein